MSFCNEYASNYAHGAPGHMDYMLIAKLSDLLIGQADVIVELHRQIVTILKSVKQ